ncbi:MAG: hypothetical protein PHQ66_02820 [Candidatus Nanoarchaeia archaeon]|nr:hypothetical protein [Candidatus Nanoarchaeia archaeon]MDD5357702.1 hypothetical protein [Candidatus Nanoarchaeia archaeon]MDD5588621.1 hypothetical protein [Candidatus Nanoarchaeia archaeon]
MKKVGLFIFTLIFLSSFVLAANCAPNNLPKIYSGTVSYNDESLTGTYEIRASMSNEVIGIGEVIDGEYSIEVTPCFNGAFSFYIGGVKANEQGSYAGISDWDVEKNLDLTINSQPFATCGNNIVEPSEECEGTNFDGRSPSDCGTNWQGTISCTSSCTISYSNCVYNPPSSGGSSGGSSSGGGSGGGGGGGGGGGSISHSTSTSSSKNTNNTPIVLENKTETESKSNSPLTGFAISDFMTSGNVIYAIIGGITLLVLGVTVIVARKKKPVESVENKTENSEKKEEDNDDGKA